MSFGDERDEPTKAPKLGDTLAIKTSYASSRIVRLRAITGQFQLLGADGEWLVGERLLGPRPTVLSWRQATDQERSAFDALVLSTERADLVDLVGVPGAVERWRSEGLDGADLNSALDDVAGELRRRRKFGKASQVDAFRLSGAA